MGNRIAGVVLALFMLVAMAGSVGATAVKSVYLKGGGVIECQSFWKKDGKVLVLVNRDTLVELAAGEVDQRKTFGAKRSKAAVVRKKAAASPAAKKAAKSEPGSSATAGAVVSAFPAQQPAPAPPATAKPEAPAPAPLATAKAEAPAPAPPVAKAPAAPQPPPAVKPALPPAVPIDAVPQLSSTLAIAVLVGILVLAIFLIASLWRVYEKAGEKGWVSLIPIYNVFVLVKIAGKPWWWFLLLFVPLVNIAITVLVHVALAARFGKSTLYGLGLAFLGIIFFPLLAFDKNAAYR